MFHAFRYHRAAIDRQVALRLIEVPYAALTHPRIKVIWKEVFNR